MRPLGSPGRWVRWLWVFLPAVLGQTENEVYGKLGGEVSLIPDAVPPIRPPIVWKEGENFAIDWDGVDLTSYRQFKERGHLNTSNGVMTIKGLTMNDSGLYTAEISEVRGRPLLLRVIYGVPVPTITTSCDEEMSRCNLTCEGDAAGAQPVAVVWMSDDEESLSSSERSRVIQKEEALDIKEFSCQMKNPVSQQRSRPILNPFTSPSGPRVSAGVVVFICLLLSVLLLVVFHRLKAGAWFFDKGSMPWEADFWQKNERTSRGAEEANGTTAYQQTADKETPMT